MLMDACRGDCTHGQCFNAVPHGDVVHGAQNIPAAVLL